MQMTKGDICKSYKEAKRKKAQVQILAELNQCSPDYIKEILKAEGVWQTPGPKPGAKPKAAIINKDFEETINEMIESVKASDPKEEPPVTMAILEAAQYGLEFMDAKIAETESFIASQQKELDKLKKARYQATEALNKIHPDNDGRLWYYDKDGCVVYVED